MQGSAHQSGFRAGIWLALTAVQLNGTALAQGVDDPAWLEQQRAAWQVPGVSAVLVREGQAPTYLNAGLCQVERKQRCTPTSQFSIASNTKFFTALLGALLAQEKHFSLSEPMDRHWPELRLSDLRFTQLSLLDLLSHRSGLGSVDWPYFWEESLSREDYLQRLAHVPMAAPLRASWHYGNANYIIAGAYYERRLRQSWRSLIRERFLAPLQMQQAGFQTPEDGTRGYALSTAGPQAYASPPMSAALDAAGGLVLSAADYARFLQMLVGEGQLGDQPLIPTRVIRRATRVQVPWGHDRRFFSGPSGYGLGVFVARYRGEAIFYHAGGALGFTAYFAVLPQPKLAVAVMSNLIGTEFNQALALDMLDWALAIPREPGHRFWLERVAENVSPPLAPDDPAAPATRPWPAYAGQFSHPAWGTFAVVAAADGLTLRMGSFQRRLVHHRFDSFSVSTEPGFEILRIRFEANFAGQIDALVMDDAVNPAPMRFARHSE